VPSISNSRFKIFDRLLGLFPTGSLVDLGTGHGAFALRAAAQGWVVTGVDARSSRFPNDNSVAWVEQDVRHHDLDRYDLIACLGLLYHLDLPDQIDLLARCRGKPLILDTHLANGRHEHRLSKEVIVDGYAGRWYSEPGLTTSSWENFRSFWPTPASFYTMLRENGYMYVLAAEPWYLPDRTFFLALADV
jgi:SAM-dependent methyltransferase